MPNPRFLRTAERWRNEEVPESREAKTPIPNLTQILERDENGRPILNLIPIEKTAVHVPTQESYDELMRVYECGGWNWSRGELPTQHDFWEIWGGETCVSRKINYSSRNYYLGINQNVISTQEFYDSQNPKITLEMLDEINAWFDENG